MATTEEVSLASQIVEILGRAIAPNQGDLSPDLARAVLAMTFPDEDQDRVSGLSVKAQDGALTVAERAELEAYIRAGDLLAMLQSKARVSLKRAGMKVEPA